VEARRVRSPDIPSVVDVFMRGFPDSLRHYCGQRTPHPDTFADMFTFLAQTEPRGFFVAEVGEKVVGYVVALSSPGKLVTGALKQPYLFRALRGILSGGYGVSLPSVFRVVWDKVRMVMAPAIRTPAGGEILSIAVSPEVRRQGVARGLMLVALEWLRSMGLRRVRLEVRPQNQAAFRLYESLGFRVHGQVKDSMGPWLVMILQFPS